MKKLISLVCILLSFVLVLSACGVNAPASETKPEAKPETKEAVATEEKTVVTMTMTTAYLNANEPNTFEEAFEKANPTIDLRIERMVTGVINGEVLRRLRNGRGSDLFVTTLPFGEVSQYTEDLSAQPFPESYQAGITSFLKIDGQTRYLPLPGSYYGYILNKTLLDELGLALPETQDELLNILAVSKEKQVRTAENGCNFGLADIGANFVGLYFISEYAPDYLSTPEGAKWIAAFHKGEEKFSENWGDSLYFPQQCIDNGYMDPMKLIIDYKVSATLPNAFKPEVALPERSAILTCGNVATYANICAASEDEFVMLPLLPRSEKGTKLVSAASNSYIAVNKAIEGDEKKNSAALAVLSFLSTEEGQKLWMADNDCPYSYLNGYNVDTSVLPEGIRSCVADSLVFTSPLKSDLVSYIGKNFVNVINGKMTLDEALTAINEYVEKGSDDVEYDMSIVGTVAVDMLYEDMNTRKQETQLGNLTSDAIREITGADVALVNGGGIRSSFYKGDVTGSDLSAVCPYGNLIIVSEMTGAVLRKAITNGIQLTWKPAGQFLQVSGVHYSFKPAKDETETAELISLTHADGTPITDDEVLKVAYTNYMGGSSGYVDAGDGYTMLNVYDTTLPVNVKLVDETGKTYGDALKAYFANHNNEEITAELEGRIVISE